MCNVGGDARQGLAQYRSRGARRNGLDPCEVILETPGVVPVDRAGRAVREPAVAAIERGDTREVVVDVRLVVGLAQRAQHHVDLRDEQPPVVVDGLADVYL